MAFINIHIMTQPIKVLVLNFTPNGNYPIDYPQAQTLLPVSEQISTMEEYLKSHEYDFISFCGCSWYDDRLLSMMLGKLGYGVMYATYPSIHEAEYFFVTGYGKCASVDYENRCPGVLGDSIDTSCCRFHFKLGSRSIVLERVYDDRQDILKIH